MGSSQTTGPSGNSPTTLATYSFCTSLEEICTSISLALAELLAKMSTMLVSDYPCQVAIACPHLAKMRTPLVSLSSLWTVCRLGSPSSVARMNSTVLWRYLPTWTVLSIKCLVQCELPAAGVDWHGGGLVHNHPVLVLVDDLDPVLGHRQLVPARHSLLEHYSAFMERCNERPCVSRTVQRALK